VAQLLSLGEAELSDEWPNYLERDLGAEHIPDLIRMATDPALNGADAESLEVWAPLHAWRALGQLRATEAIEPLLPLFEELEDSDWAGEELPVVYGMIGAAALPALTSYLADSTHQSWPRITAAHAIEQIGSADQASRPAAVEALSQQLERFAENDPELNGFLISFLIDLHAVETAPLIERAFAAERVELSIPGDWEDVQVSLGLLAARTSPPRTYSLFPQLTLPAAAPAPRARSADRAAAKVKNKRKQAKASRKKNRRGK
jgi:hypothetical protein